MNAVSATSIWMAAARAKETAREDRLFVDSYAAALAGLAGNGASAAAGDISYMSIRTRYFDDALHHAIQLAGLRQLVIVGAGLDARAFRMHWPGDLCIYELDQPEVFSYKEPILRRANAQASCRRVVLPLDLAQPWAHSLLHAGYREDVLAIFLLEGVLMYLTLQQAADCLRTVTGLTCAGSTLLADLVNTDMLTSPYTKDLMADLARRGCPWQFAVADPVEMLRPLGWKASVVSPGEPEANFGRWPHRVAPRHVTGVPRMYLLSAHRE